VYLTVSLRKQPILNLGKLHRGGTFRIIITHMIDPRTHWIAPHQPSIVGLHHVGRRGHIPDSQPQLMHTGHQLEECGFPNVAEANGLRPISTLSRSRGGDYECNRDLSPPETIAPDRTSHASLWLSERWVLRTREGVLGVVPLSDVGEPFSGKGFCREEPRWHFLRW
jgi:hypothetical protein